MEGVTQERKAGEIVVKDRTSGLVVKENIPPYIQLALKSMFSSGARCLARFVWRRLIIDGCCRLWPCDDHAKELSAHHDCTLGALSVALLSFSNWRLL